MDGNEESAAIPAGVDPASGGDPPGVYRLSPGRDPTPEPPVTAVALNGAGDAVLLWRHAAWFCRLRWRVVGLMAAAGLVGLLAPAPVLVGLRLPRLWPWVVAGILALLNLAYLRRIPREDSPADAVQPRLHLWVQIGLDLLVLTGVVHCLGSVETYAPLMYLFHIVLACIFFPPLHSLGVTAASAVLYLSCLVLETHGLVPPATVLGYGGLAQHAELPAGFWGWRIGSIFGVWGIIWYLASGLAGRLRRREEELAVSNQRLQASGEERTRHMLQTTHQLKAPLAAIHANVQLLLGGYCGRLPEPALSVVGKVMERCVALAQQIQEMLQLANLRSEGQAPPAPAEVDLVAAMQTAVTAVEPTASRRGVRFVCDLHPVAVCLAEDHLRMLLDNLLSNAVNYSYAGGTVTVGCGPGPSPDAVVTVADQGIGIPADKLPKVFEDYYRTAEATRHNKASTGLGLAVVRDVVRLTGITLEVESRVGQGTCFRLTIPRCPDPVHTAAYNTGRNPAWHTC